MATIASLLVNLGMNTAAFEAGTNRARRSMNQMANEINASASRMKNLATAAAGIFVGTRVLGFAKAQMQAIDKTAKLSDALGVGTEQLVGFQRSAQLSGVSTETMNRSLQYLAKNLGTAVTTGGTAAATIERLGLNAQQLAAAGIGDSFMTIADAISRLPTPAERASAAIEIFGRSGADLLPMLAEGRAGLELVAAAVLKTGEAFNRLGAAKVEALNDAITNMSGALTGLVTDVLIDLSPLLIEFTTSVVAAARAFKTFADTIFGGIAGLLKTIAAFWIFVNVAGVVSRTMLFLIKVYKGLALAQGIVNALMSASVTGVAAFVVSAVLAAGAVVAIDVMFNEIEGGAKSASDAMQELAAATDDAADAQSRLNEIDPRETRFRTALEYIQDLEGRVNDIQRRAAGWTEMDVKLFGLGGQAALPLVPRAWEAEEQIRTFERQAELAETIRDAFASVNREIAIFGKGPAAGIEYDLLALGTNESIIALYSERVGLLDEMRRSTDELAESERRVAAIGQRWFDATRTPAERFITAFEGINDALIAGTLSLETWGRAAEQLVDELNRGQARTARGTFRQIESARIDVRGLAGGDSRRQELNAALSLLEIQRKMLDSINAIKQDGGGLAS